MPEADEQAKEVLKSVKEKTDGEPVFVAKLSRISGATYLFVEVADEIEGLFSASYRRSTEWTDGEDTHEFYEKNYTGELSDFMEGKYDNYGSDFIKAGDANKAIFRTAGLSEGQTFKIDGPHSETAIREAVKDLRQFAEELYNQFFSTTVLVSEIKRLDFSDLNTTGGE